MFSHVLVSQSCLTLCQPMDCRPPGFSVQGISQARILEWVAISFSRGFFPKQGSNPGLLHCRQILYHQSYQGKHATLYKTDTLLLRSGGNTCLPSASHRDSPDQQTDCAERCRAWWLLQIERTIRCCSWWVIVTRRHPVKLINGSCNS